MKKFLLVFLLGFFHLSFSQLSNFNLQVTATNETCSGNGTLSFLVTNTTAGASVVYSVFLLPNTTTPIAITSNSSLTGLVAGNYQVVASQTLGPNTSTQEQNITLFDQIENLAFTISDQKVKCGNDGILTAVITTGNAVSYELLSGPVTAPAQVSNTFSGLPIGNYSIRVFDTCGNAVVNSFTLTQGYTAPIVLFSEGTDVTCNTINLEVLGNFSNPNIAYPLTVQIVVHPPNNATSIVYNQILNFYPTQGIQQVIPRYDGGFNYDVKVTDNCGNSSEINTIYINKNFSYSVFVLQGCTPKISISTENAILPYSIEFLSSPAGFDPVTLNPGFPGPYLILDVTLNVIAGNYTIKLTDACGKFHVVNFQVTNDETPVVSSASIDGCGGISISIDEIYEVTLNTVTLVSAPVTYTGNLPQNLSAYINSLDYYSWTLSGFPQGTYVFNVLDSCGVLHIKTVTVGPAQSLSMNVVNYPECQPGNGSVYIFYGSSSLNDVKITNAPSNFPFPLPYSVPAVGSMAFVLINVPVGSYIIQVTSGCGNVQTNNFMVQNYIDSNTTFELEKFCSSFNLKFTQQGNAISPSYGLQKLNETTGNWEHPETGLQIINNQINSGNFYAILPNQWNVNLNFLGKFRILEAYTTISSQTCVQSIQEFEVSSQPQVLNHNVINCGSGTSVVQLNAIGIGQLNYKITQKNNLPFLVNNGTNNVFANLQPAIYNFQIEDSCGNILNHQIEINTSFPIQIIPNLCENQLSNLSADNYSFLQYEWWKAGAPSTILSTTSVLTFNPFVSSINSGLYYLRITHIGNPTSCLNGVLTYTISPQAIPLAGSDNTVNFCGLQNTVNLNSCLSGIFDTNGTWQEITTSNSLPVNGIWNTSVVNYGVYKFRYVVNGFCSNTDEAIITITINEKPVVANLPNLYTICRGENLQINSGFTNANNFYQWIGPNNFSSTNAILELNAIENISNGQYSLVVGNTGCYSDPYSFSIEVISIPEFYISETCENNIKTLTAIPIDGTFESSSFNWTGPNGFTSDLNPMSVPTGNTGDYALTIEKNNCEIFKEITVFSTACEIPKGISPNGDGLNEFFDLSGFDVKSIKIYNRFGKIVYSKDNGYKNEWYGQADNGNILPDATYFYGVLLNSGESKTGWVYVTR